RFERGVDPQLQLKAIQRASGLLLDIVGGKAGPIIHQVSQDNVPVNPLVELRHERIERLLGIPVTVEQVENILNKLDMSVSGIAGGWNVTAPSYRFDINIEADLIEEVGRVYGYNNIPGTKEAAHIAMASFSETYISENQLKDSLVSHGYHEAITYSFVSPELQSILHPQQATLSLANPISSDMSEMRTRLLPGLIQAVQHNLNRQQPRIRLFETGLCFVPEGEKLIQRTHIAAVITGLSESESWVGSNQSVDFYDIKGHLQNLMNLANEQDFDFRPSSNEILHPGQSADVFFKGDLVGFVGALHPAVLKSLDIDQQLFVFELEIAGLTQTELAEFNELSKFPSIRRDLALIVDQDITVQQLINSINGIKSEIIQDVFVFDVYTGKEVIINRKSIALGLILQGFSRTLTDKDVEETVSHVLQILKKEHNAVLR
ncbi:MAG: phenylalanine--tRNA ligase subunit beta, partial [Gammaproteobacteria bacterium]|nr:phenylalanine--tRNA ligase subunit beta [Gammaproteobacteria bacterium]